MQCVCKILGATSRCTIDNQPPSSSDDDVFAVMFLLIMCCIPLCCYPFISLAPLKPD